MLENGTRITFDIDKQDKEALVDVFDQYGFGRTFSIGMRQLVMIAVDHPEILSLKTDDTVKITNREADSKFDQIQNSLDDVKEDVVNSVKSTNQTAEITHQLVTELQEDVNRVNDSVNDLSHSESGQQFDQEAMDEFRKQLINDLKIVMFDYMMNNQRGFAQPASNQDDHAY